MKTFSEEMADVIKNTADITEHLIFHQLCQKFRKRSIN